jgi:hypothetical protein
VRHRRRLLGTLAGRPFAGALGEDTTLTPTAPVQAPDVLTVLDDRTKEILRRLDEDAKNRRFALIIAGASALFAALKLGIIAFPALRSRVGRLP